MNFKSRYGFSALMVTAILMPSTVRAEIYKCENIKNEIYYIDKPCPVLDKETEIAAVKDPKNGYVFPAFVSDKVHKNKEWAINQKNIKTTKDRIKDKDGDDLTGEGNGKGGAISVLNTQNNVPIVSSSGRESEAPSSRPKFDEQTRFIMKVEEDTREPL